MPRRPRGSRSAGGTSTVCVSEISLTASAGASPERSIPTFRACFRTTTPRFCACALPAGPSRRRSAHPTLRDARQEAGRPLVCAAARPARAQPQDGRKVVAPPGLVGQSFDGDDIAVDGKKSRFAPACPPLTAAQEPALTHGSDARRRPRAPSRPTRSRPRRKPRAPSSALAATTRWGTFSAPASSSAASMPLRRRRAACRRSRHSGAKRVAVNAGAASWKRSTAGTSGDDAHTTEAGAKYSR